MYKRFVKWYIKRRQAYYAKHDHPDLIGSKSNYIKDLAVSLRDEELAIYIAERFPLIRLSGLLHVEYPQWEPLPGPDGKTWYDTRKVI